MSIDYDDATTPAPGVRLVTGGLVAVLTEPELDGWHAMSPDADTGYLEVKPVDAADLAAGVALVPATVLEDLAGEFAERAAEHEEGWSAEHEEGWSAAGGLVAADVWRAAAGLVGEYLAAAHEGQQQPSGGKRP